MRKIRDAVLGIPAERSRQFELIERARKRLMKWAQAENIPLRHVEFVVPFIETDFSLSAWFFYSDELSVASLEGDGTSGRVIQRFKLELANAEYPTHWLSVVECRFASKEVVDRDYAGSYYHYVR
jgi:hypothetical protein